MAAAADMADGTRIRSLDERLGVHDVKLTEMTEGLIVCREEMAKKLGEVNSRMDGFRCVDRP